MTGKNILNNFDINMPQAQVLKEQENMWSTIYTIKDIFVKKIRKVFKFEDYALSDKLTIYAEPRC